MIYLETGKCLRESALLDEGNAVIKMLVVTWASKRQGSGRYYPELIRVAEVISM